MHAYHRNFIYVCDHNNNKGKNLQNDTIPDTPPHTINPRKKCQHHMKFSEQLLYSNDNVLSLTPYPDNFLAKIIHHVSLLRAFSAAGLCKLMSSSCRPLVRARRRRFRIRPRSRNTFHSHSRDGEDFLLSLRAPIPDLILVTRDPRFGTTVTGAGDCISKSRGGVKPIRLP